MVGSAQNHDKEISSLSMSTRPPSVDSLARSLSHIDLPHPLLVDAARQAIAAGDVSSAEHIALDIWNSLLRPVINATGILAHTNLGRAPLSTPANDADAPTRGSNLEFDLRTGQRGNRQAGISRLLARLCGCEDALVVNNNAAAVLLVLAALAEDRDVAVSRGESVEIGGGFRIPEVMEQSGARLVDVGTTNRTRVNDYRKAVNRRHADVALILKVHPSNYRIEGFVESTSVEDLSTVGPPVVADIGSGLLDSTCPWLSAGPPTWLIGEPAARQSLAAGASLVTFSGDKLMGGPQSGIIAGRADLVRACASHPLARALRPGGLVLAALHRTASAYLDKSAERSIPFWQMATVSEAALSTRASHITTTTGRGRVVPCLALPGAGSVPGASIASMGIALDGDHAAALRSFQAPIIARVKDGQTILDLRTVDPADDSVLIAALASLSGNE